MRRVKLGLGRRHTGPAHSLLAKRLAEDQICLLESSKGEAGEKAQKRILGSQDTPNAMLERILKYLSFMLPVPNARSSVLSVFLGRTPSQPRQLLSPFPGVSS